MNNTLKNGFRVLELLSASGESIAVKDISSALDLPKSHACRLLKTLTHTGYVQQDSSRKYKISMKILSLANMCLSKHEIRNRVHPFVLKLYREIPIDASLCIPIENRPMIIEMAYYKANSNEALTIGSFQPIHCSASGKVCAAYFSEDELENYLQNNTLTKYTENTITDPDEFRIHLKKVREDKLAWIKKERDSFSVACASPVFDSAGKMICIIGANFVKQTQNEKLLKEYGNRVREAASAASFALGYTEYDL